MKEFEGALLKQMELDLSVNAPYMKGHPNPVRNCWHFYTDGNAVDRLFDDREDFKAGMNRVFTVGRKYRLFILAFVLMDTHVHFVIWGDFDKCNKFIHEYIRVTSIYIQNKCGERNKLKRVSISHQKITDDYYLKSAICYVLKNATNAGMNFLACDYPWGSCPLYFRSKGYWSSPLFTTDLYNLNQKHSNLNQMCVRDRRTLLKTRHNDQAEDIEIIDGIVYPGEYIPYKSVERIFKTAKSFSFFMNRTKEEDIEKVEGTISRLSIPIQELRQHREEICRSLYGNKTIRQLSAEERLKIVQIMKGKLHSSPKQIYRVCCLKYDENNNHK